MQYQITEKDFTISKKKQNDLALFWAGFILYTAGYTLTSAMAYIKIAQLQLLQIAGIALFVYAALNILKYKIKNSYLNVLFTALMLWSLGIIFRGITFDFNYIKELLFDAGYGIFPFLTPLFLLFPQNFAYYRKLFGTLIVLSVLHFLFTAVFYKDIFNSDRQSVMSQGMVEYFTTMGFSISFLLLTYLYHEPKKRLFAMGMMAFSLLCVVYRARRGWIFMHLTTLLSVLMIYLIVSKKTIMVTYLALIMALVGYFYFSSMYNQTNFGIFNFLVERGDEDTRGGVEDLFYEDMQTNDWLMGRGIKGEYYCPGIDPLDTRGYRSVIETGFLHIILKGGIVYLILLMLILVPAFIMGLFKSNNTLSKASGLIILLWIIYLYPTVGNTFSPQYILVWIATGICYSPKIRSLDDDEISLYMQGKPTLKAI